MSRNQANGLVVGIVTSLEDPEKLGRIKVKYPILNNQEGEWARISSVGAGSDRGLFFRPEVDDEVLVAFELGESRRPYILGGVWNTVDKPPRDDEKPKENNWRFIKSRCGHIIKLDDTSEKEKIEIIDKDNTRHISIDSAQEKITITCESGNIEIKAPNGDVQIESQNVSIKSSANMTLEATGTMTIKGSTVNIN